MKPRALDLFCCAGGATRGLQEAGFHVTGVDIKPQRHYCGDEFRQADALTFEFSSACEFQGGSGDFHPEICDRCGLDWDRHFDFIWASPPCQAFTALRYMPTHKKDHPNLIPQTRARLVASGIPYSIENVEGAPLGESGHLIMLCGTMFGLQTADGRAELRRHRLFETSFSIPLRPSCQHGVAALGVYGGHVRDRCRNVITVVGHTPVDNKRVITVCGEGGRKGGMKGKTLPEGTRERQVFTTQQAREAMGIDWMPMSRLSQAIPPAYSHFIGEQALRYIHATTLTFPIDTASK